MGSGNIILKGKDWDSSIPDKVILKNFKEFQRSKSFGVTLNYHKKTIGLYGIN
jgi:hypothetical protein